MQPSPLRPLPHRTRPRYGVQSRVGWTALTLMLAAAGPASSQVETTFDTDLAGWVVSGDNVTFWNPTGGLPDGCLEIDDAAAGPWSVATSPIEFLGSWSAMTAADSLSYDAIHMPSGTQMGNPPYVFRIEGPGGVAEWSPSPFPPNVWNHLAAPIDAAAWDVLSGTWPDIVANVTLLAVAAEMISGGEVVRLDNIRLSGTPDSVSIQCAFQDFEVGAVGWNATAASATVIANGGDAGDYLRIQESGAGAHLSLPAWYGGDWSSFDGSGTISLSITFLLNVAPGGEIRLDVSGPGGAAYASVPTDDFIPLRRFWNDVSWPIDAASWTVTSGGWGALLTDVQAITFQVNASSNGDRYGVDNVFRGAATCAPGSTNPIVFHEPGYAVVQAHRFRESAALAINPADGRLYTLVNGSVANGGGVYPVTGPDAGIRFHTYSAPAGLVFTADGDGFVTENGSGNLYRFVGADSSSTWGSTFHAGDDDPAGMIVAPPSFVGPNVNPGDLLITDHGNGGPDEIWVASPDTAHVERLLVPDPGNVDWYDLATDGTTVWACDAVDDDVLSVIHPDGTLSAFGLSQNVGNMRAIAYDAGEHVLYAQQTTSPPGVYRIDATDGQVTLIADGFGVLGFGNLEVDAAARRLWVSDETQSRVYEISLPPATVAVDEPILASTALFLSIGPNPVRSVADIRLGLARATDVRIDVFDARGRRVRSLELGPRPAGAVHVSWDARDDRGRRVAAGVYFVRAEAHAETRSKKVVVLR